MLNKLSRVDFFEAGAIREVLRGRGSSDVELALVEQMSSPEAGHRLQVIEDLSVLPAGQARRLLRSLLHDPNAEVRYRALSVMATTEDPQLFDLAKERALSDPDNRVAELASRIMRQAR